MTTVFIDIETVPCADKEPFIKEARDNFKAPSSLTKEKAGADLDLAGDELKFKNKESVIALWEQRFSAEKAPEVADEAWRKTALDGSRGRIVSIAWELSDGQAGLICQDPETETGVLGYFCDKLSRQLISHGAGRPAYFVGHNLTFDLKFLFRRCVILGIRPTFDLPFRGRHGHDYFCTMQAWCEYGERISLDNLCAALGIDGKGDMDGSMVCDLWLAGRYADIGVYNEADVERAKQVYQALTFQRLAA